MAKHAKPGDAEKYRLQLIGLLENFEEHLKNSELRTQVLELIPATKLLRNLGCSLLQGPDTESARARILSYLKKYVSVVLSGEELMVVAGISEYGRRIRELRVQFGWQILTGHTLKNMEPEELAVLFGEDQMKLRPDQYILLSEKEDREAAHRWHVANEIRKDRKLSSRDKILKFMLGFIGKEITGEELFYVGNTSEWARRVRELRTEYGWPIATHFTGRPDLPPGIYVLESNRQAPKHDRKIPETVSRAVLMRDKYTCQDCGWTHALWNPSDPRHLEAHHIKEHAKGGENTEGNLITICNICHDARHRK